MVSSFFKHIRKLVMTIMMVLIFLSCKKEWYGIKSDKSLTVPSLLQDLEYLLDNMAVMNENAPGLGEISSDGHYTPDQILGILPSFSEVNVQRNAYMWSNTFPYVEVRDWNFGYRKIFYSNLVLDGLDKIKPITIDEQRQFREVKGNALFHKAKNYFDLAQLYAQPFNNSTAATDLGIPLKDGVDVTEISKRSSVLETYNQIITDLLTAKDLLPLKAKFLTRGSHTSALALLARVYLIMGDYANAYAYADSSLAEYNTLIDFNSIPAHNLNMGQFNQETIHYSLMIYWTLISSGVVYIDSSLYNLYDQNDLRKTRFFKSSNLGIGFKGTYNKTPALFSGLATDELYLIKAECAARKGNTTEALKTLNDLLITRWDNAVPYPEVTAATADEALEKVIAERRKELLMRGLRWSDLRRLNTEDKFKTTVSRTTGGQTYLLKPNSYQYTFPIPQDVINLSQIQQNPNW